MDGGTGIMAELSRGQILKNPEILGVSTAGAQLILWDGDETNTVTIKVPDSVAANYALTLPPNDGDSNQFLRTDGSGVLTWATVTATAGGSNTQLQFNSAGAFAGAVGLTTDGTNLTITAAGEVRFADTDSSNYVSFKSPGTVAANRNYTLPALIGTAGQVLKLATGATATAATLEWSDDLQGAGATAAGTDTQIQFNDGGTAFGGDAGFTYNKTTDSATLVGTMTAGAFVADLTTLDANTITTSSGSFSLNPTTSVDILAVKPLRLYDADSSNFAGIVAPSAVTSNYTLTLPPAIGSANSNIQYNASGVGAFVSNIRNLNFVIEEGGLAIGTGVKGYVEIPFNCQVTQWSILGDGTATSAIVVDVWRTTFAAFAPPTTPTAANSIAGTELPTITSGQQKAQDTSITTWSTVDGVVGGLIAGDIIAFNVNSNTNFKRVTVVLTVRLR